MTTDDLAVHETVVREPVSVAYRDAAVHVQPPSSQAILLAMALAALDREPAAAGAEGAHRAIEAIVAAFARRDEVTSTPEDELLEAAAAIELPARASRQVVARAYNHTTAVTAAQPDGLTVSMLISVFDPFGCGTYVPEGGFFLNDRMLGFSRDPDSPNAPASGKRPVHTLSPALYEHGGRAVAIATPGADGQVQVLLQLLQALVDEGEDPAVALDRGRWRAVGGRLVVEDDLVDGLGRELAALGHAVEATATGDGLFGSVCIAQADPDAGVATAWADGRRESWAGAW
jgi:gamma-glutamyltranspeptidase/glutathione hydrolase